MEHWAKSLEKSGKARTDYPALTLDAARATFVKIPAAEADLGIDERLPSDCVIGWRRSSAAAQRRAHSHTSDTQRGERTETCCGIKTKRATGSHALQVETQKAG